VNFFAFIGGTFLVGGDAVNGDAKCPPRRHYLWDKPGTRYLWDQMRSDRCHEVGRAVYLYSKAHCYSVFLSWPLAMAGGFYLNRVESLSVRA